MDKSEGKNFFSKTFSSVTEKVAKWYHTGNVKLSISSLKRARAEKVQALGNKVLDILEKGNSLSFENVKAEYNSIRDLDEEIRKTEIDLEKMQAAEAAPQENPVKKSAEKKTAVKKTTAAKTASAKTATAKKSPVKKTTVKKTTAAKKTTAKKTTKLPVVKTKSTPAVKIEETPAVKHETEIMVKNDPENA